MIISIVNVFNFHNITYKFVKRIVFVNFVKRNFINIFIFLHFQDDTTVEANARIGRALRQTWESDSLDHPKENVDPTEQERQNKERPQQIAVPATKSEGGNKTCSLTNALNVVLLTKV